MHTRRCMPGSAPKEMMRRYIAASKPATLMSSSSLVLYMGKSHPQNDRGSLFGLCLRPLVYLNKDIKCQ